MEALSSKHNIYLWFRPYLATISFLASDEGDDFEGTCQSSWPTLVNCPLEEYNVESRTIVS